MTAAQSRRSEAGDGAVASGSSGGDEDLSRSLFIVQAVVACAPLTTLGALGSVVVALGLSMGHGAAAADVRDWTGSDWVVALGYAVALPVALTAFWTLAWSFVVHGRERLARRSGLWWGAASLGVALVVTGWLWPHGDHEESAFEPQHGFVLGTPLALGLAHLFAERIAWRWRRSR